MWCETLKTRSRGFINTAWVFVMFVMTVGVVPVVVVVRESVVLDLVVWSAETKRQRDVKVTNWRRRWTSLVWTNRTCKDIKHRPRCMLGEYELHRAANSEFISLLHHHYSFASNLQFYQHNKISAKWISTKFYKATNEDVTMWSNARPSFFDLENQTSNFWVFVTESTPVLVFNLHWSCQRLSFLLLTMWRLRHLRYFFGQNSSVIQKIQTAEETEEPEGESTPNRGTIYPLRRNQ